MVAEELTPVHYLYSLRDVHFLPEHRPRPEKAHLGNVIDWEEFILSMIVTTAVGMDSLQYLKLVDEESSVSMVCLAVTAYSNCVMAQLS